MAKKRAKQKALDLTLPIYELKISLQQVEPLIWRRVQTDDCSLDELHEIIQAVMGWEDMHTFVFEIEEEEYTNVEEVGVGEYLDSRKARLSTFAERGCRRFCYEYDMGDSWRHTVEIETTLPAAKDVRYPRCVAGERACPPEDCGGPHGYAYFLDKIQDPQHDEHEGALEWVGGQFDPEEFDLDEVDREIRRLRRWLGKRRGPNSPPSAFAKGDLVRVKPGVVHGRYPDIPLGGWVGRVKRIAWLTPIGYAVRWTQPTLDQAHTIYFKRCQRDERKPDRYWLDEGQLESASDETPAAMEQPTKIVTPPLSMDGPDDRNRMVFGLTTDDALPKADAQSQRHFLDYLKAHVSFPFQAEYWPASVLGPRKSDKVTVLSFADPPMDRKEGIVCEAHKGKDKVQVPLAGLHLNEDDPNFQYVEDYTCWLWEVHDEEEDEAVEERQFPIGTIAYYGPDDKITTKIVAGVIEDETAKSIIKRWVATDVMTNPKVQKEIGRFFKKHGVKRVEMSEGNMGCPHEEGEDFPVGGDCPFCPWWKGKQGSGAEE